MLDISFTEFREHAKDYFDAVEKGETVRVTRHGKIIAEIVPPNKRLLRWKRLPNGLTIKGVSAAGVLLEEREKSR